MSLPLLCILASLYGCGGGSSSSQNANGSPGQANGSNPNNPANGGGGQPADPNAPLINALASGNGSTLSLGTVMGAAQTLISGQISEYGSVKQAVFNGVGPIDWDPSQDSSYFTVLDVARNHVLLPSNWKYKGNAAGSGATLAVAGTAPVSKARYAAFGGNPLGVPGNAAMDKLMTNTVGWLSSRAGSGNFKVVVAHMPGTETYWYPHEKKVRDWFYGKYTGVTVNNLASGASQQDNSCDGTALAGCLQGADLLVIGREQGPGSYSGDTVMKAVTDAQARGIPVLYLHHYRDANDLAGRMLDYFGLDQEINYWSEEGLKAFNPASLPSAPAQLSAMQALLNRLEQGSFSTNWSGCSNAMRIDCSGDATYMAEFGTLAAQIRDALRKFDSDSTQLFARPGYQLEKLLVLLGDKYRENVSYPMDKSANKQDFFRAYFSDATAYITRSSSSVAKNLGNFSAPIATSTPTLSQTVTVTLPASGSKEYLTGLYVIPGKTVTLTRTDGGNGPVHFGLNMLRDTTRIFNTYDRPTNISSPRPALEQNKPVSITSPFGGPLMLFVDAATSGSQPVTVRVDGVITHPVLRNPNDPAAVAAFQNEVNTTPTNWVGFTTDTLTIHSTLDHFKQTIADYNGNMAALASDIAVYTVKDTYELAGFNSASGQLQLANGVTAFCNSKGWDCTGLQHRRDVMQHVISDSHALCGNGCSGNPFDEDWAFDPLGWGESHEIGHNLQQSRLNVYGGKSTEVSNNIFPVHKQMKYNLSAAGIASPIRSHAGAGQEVFDIVKAALGTADPVTSMYNSSWSDASYAANGTPRLMFYRQLVEYARYYNNGGQFQDGWEIVPLLYLLNRNFAQANDASWSSKAAGFGFGTYAGSYPGSMDGNDFLLIASSNIIGRDMRPMFALWGITTTSAAQAQVAAYNYQSSQALYFPMNTVISPKDKVGAPIVMSAGASYPAGY
ncbi:ImpA family metalloprotease [Pseudoduganella violaceinigra]|uniref:ImpA family metalloprotease n=1 Tax=Pseudoduganella violaceinigra TaxID=246602 RepID=UPI0003F8C5FC|nr:ImpA family metalloprotease [Pseudoduganella violaceinigra]